MTILAAVYTRYDGWILGAAVWCVVAVALARRRDVWRNVVPSFACFTLLAVAGPVSWLAYNQYFFHDPLDFLRGPNSASAIEKKTATAGSGHHPGWHNPFWAFVYYTRTAQVDAAFWETGFLCDGGGFVGAGIGGPAKSGASFVVAVDSSAVLCLLGCLWVGADFYSAALAFFLLQLSIWHGAAAGVGAVCVSRGAVG